MNAKANPNHSTGPRTAAGIENCKYNATRHGLTGKQLVLNGENAADYDALRLALIDENQPASEDEAMLVERISQNYWKMLRAERYEQQLFDYFAAINEDVFGTKRYQNYIRYRNAIERAWNRARTELAILKKAARKDEPQQVAKQPKPQKQSVSYEASTAAPDPQSIPLAASANRPLTHETDGSNLR